MLEKRRLLPRFVALSLLACVATGALAEKEADAQPAFRVGLTNDPDALFLGFQYGIFLADAGSGFFLFEPGVDLGVAEGPVDFFLRGTFHFKFVVPVGRGDFAIYPLIGPALAYYNFDDNRDDTEVGIDLGFGFGFKQFSFEIWAAFDQLPDITASFAFHF